MIAGLEDISGGVVRIGERVVNDLPPRKRNISMVFQNYALYPHMNVRENLGFGLKIAGETAESIAKRVDEAADILGLTPLLDLEVRRLSAGQRRRLAMGRLVGSPRALWLLDEPMAPLDARWRDAFADQMRRHLDADGLIVAAVHDPLPLASRTLDLGGRA